MDAIIQAVDDLPEYFEKFCSILNITSCYDYLVKSLVTCYVVYKSEEHIKKYINIDKLLVYFMGSLTLNELLVETASADKCSNSREECFIKILQRKDPKFIDELMNYLALKDCPNHKELLHHLQSSKDNFYKSLCIPSVVNYLPGIKRYQDFLKRFYIDMIKVEVQDTFNDNIHQYINLSLITPQNQESSNEYFKALRDPHHLLFNHKEYTTTVPLKSLAEIIDTSELIPQVILIQGSPGSGKTTLANEICIEWSKGNLIQHYLLVILLKLRDPRIDAIISMDKVISCTVGDSNFASEVVRDIEFIDGKRILLLLEGWDELPEKKQYESFYSNIISGTILKKGDVLITSRPSSIGSIPKRFITRHIAILGFSEDQIKQFLDHCFTGSSNELKDSLKSSFWLQLNSNPLLKSLAYVPVNLSILVHVFKQYGAKLPSTLTELYQQYVLLKLSLYNQRVSNDSTMLTDLNNLPDHIIESLNDLGELSYCGIRDKKLHYTQHEVEKYCKLHRSVPLDYDGMGLLQVENDLLNRNSYKIYHFMHKTVQEFLAAWHATKMQEQKIILENFKNEDFEMVLVFYAGLTGFKLFDFLKLFPLIKNDSSSISLPEKARSSVLKALCKHNVSKLIFKLNKISKYSENDNQHCLLVLVACCAESKNPAACKAFSYSRIFHRDICYIDIPDSAVTPQLLASLSYCIAHSSRSWIVDCNKVFSKDDNLSLQKYLIDSNETSGHIVYLSLKSNKIEIEFFITFLQPQFALQSLDLGYSKFDDDSVTVLCAALKINVSLLLLLLYNCKISSKGVLTIAEMLCVNNTLQYIDLQQNSFSDDDLIQFLVTIKSNTTLAIMEVNTDLLQKNVNKQLAMFNKKRRNQLVLESSKTFRFSRLLEKFGMI